MLGTIVVSLLGIAMTCAIAYLAMEGFSRREIRKMHEAADEHRASVARAFAAYMQDLQDESDEWDREFWAQVKGE